MTEWNLEGSLNLARLEVGSKGALELITVEPRLSGLGGTRVNSPDNRESG